MTLLLDHLWQSSIVLVVIGALTLFFRGNGAHVRHALWAAASLKFLLPFAGLTALSSVLSALLSGPLPAPLTLTQSFSHDILIAPAVAPLNWLPPVAAAWAAGFLVVCGTWLTRWRKLRATLRRARGADITAPMPVKVTSALLEPGLVGIFHPVLLLPAGIAEKLSEAELRAIVAHESCHLGRRDNLWAALHMLVEAMFWFWPPVWWLGTRLIAEREKACDEAVLAAGSDPQIYAESILKVCKFYVHSPLACAAGVSGADLKQRMEDIMRNAVIARINVPKKALLAASAVVMLVPPLVAGVFTTPAALAQGIVSAPVTEEVTASASLMTGLRPMPLPPQPTPQTNQAVRTSCGAVSAAPSMTHRPPPYPAASQAQSRQGTVIFAVAIDREGRATSAAINESSGDKELDACAVGWVESQWRWDPQGQNGGSAALKRRVVVHFRLVPVTP